MKKLIEKGWEIKEIADHARLQQEYDNWPELFTIVNNSG